MSRQNTSDVLRARTFTRTARLAIATIVSALVCLAPAPAQEFSADLVAIEVEGQPVMTGKVKVASGNVHFETPDLPGIFFLISTHPNAAYLVRPAQRVYMDARQSSRVTQLFVTVDPDDPCPQWQAMTKIAGPSDLRSQRDVEWHCERMGSETIEGRNTVRFQAVSQDGQRRSGWIDPLLRFPLKIAAEGGTIFELKSIVEGLQPMSGFEIPAGFLKFDPQLLIDRIKQSDVWVEEPQQDRQ